MPYIDVVILVILLVFVLLGFFFGFLHSIGSIIGTIAGLILANKFIDIVFNFIGHYFGNSSITRIVVFILLYVLFTRLIGVVFWLLGKVFRIISWIPFAKTVDRLLGAGLGLIEGVIFIGVVLVFSMQVVPKEILSELLKTSTFTKYFVTILSFIPFILPTDIKSLMETATKLISKSIPK